MEKLITKPVGIQKHALVSLTQDTEIHLGVIYKEGDIWVFAPVGKDSIWFHGTFRGTVRGAKYWVKGK